MASARYSPSSVDDIAREIRDAYADQDHEYALRLFIQLSDNLVKSSIEHLYAMLVVEPVQTGDAGWDAAIRALVEYRLRLRDIPVPAWARPTTPPLAKPWSIPGNIYEIPVDLFSVPKEFLFRGVLIEAMTLESV